MAKIGIISDTHGRLSSKIFQLFNEVDLIIHAGDIGSEDIITELETICTVVAVHGNMDSYELSKKYPKQLDIDKFGIKIHLSHKDPHMAGSVDMIIQGHTHLPEIRRESGKLYINPGKASESIAIIEIQNNNRIDAKIVFM